MCIVASHPKPSVEAHRSCHILLSDLCSYILNKQVPLQVTSEGSHCQDHFLVMLYNRHRSAMKNTSDPSVCLNPQTPVQSKV